MAPWLILAVGAVYVATAVDFYVNNRPGMALMFVGYAIANLGLWFDGR